jgi:hypothetical protein
VALLFGSIFDVLGQHGECSNKLSWPHQFSVVHMADFLRNSWNPRQQIQSSSLEKVLGWVLVKALELAVERQWLLVATMATTDRSANRCYQWRYHLSQTIHCPH